MKKLKTFHSSYFISKSHLVENDVQNYLVFQPMKRYFKRVSNDNEYITPWKSKGFFDEVIKSIATSNYKITPQLSYYGTKTKVKFNGSCLKEDKAKFNYERIVNINIVYEISRNFNISCYPTL